MRVIGLPEFQRCTTTTLRTETDGQDLQALVEKLAEEHTSAAMRSAAIHIGGTPIRLWATHELRLTTGRYRITWRYESRSGTEVVVCFTLAEA